MSVHIDTVEGQVDEPSRGPSDRPDEPPPKPPPPRERLAVEWKRLRRRAERLKAD